MDSLVRVSRRVDRAPCRRAADIVDGRSAKALTNAERDAARRMAADEPPGAGRSWRPRDPRRAATGDSREGIRSRRADARALPSRRFQVLVTLFPKSFSPFPHGTCSLSGPRSYSALGGIHHPIGVAFPSNLTPRSRLVQRDRRGPRDCHPLGCRPPADFAPAPRRERPCTPQLAVRRFPAWALPISLAVTRGIRVRFSSSA